MRQFRIRHGLAALVIFIAGIMTHITWVYANDIATQVQACQQTNCVEVADIAERLENVQPPVLKPQQKRKG